MSRYKLPLEQTQVKTPPPAESLFVDDGFKQTEQVQLPETNSIDALDLNALIVRNQHLEKTLLTLQSDNDRLSSELEQLKTQAHSSAYQEGLELAEATLKNEIDELRQLHQTIATEFDASVNTVAEYIADIVVEANIKLLGKQLTDKKIALDAVKEVLKRAGYQETITVKLSPRDHELVNKHKIKLSPAKNIEYLSDDKVKLGGCIVNTDFGLFDGRIEVQLQALHDLLNGVG